MKKRIIRIISFALAIVAVIGATLYLLDSAWGFGSEELAAPQATLMKMIIEGVMGGTTTYDSMLAFMITGGNGLPQFAEDPVAVAAMREACHHNLYAIANSQAMNGIGEDTTIKVTEPMAQTVTRILTFVFIPLFILSLVMWIIKVNKFKKTEAYISYKEFKKFLKNIFHYLLNRFLHFHQ